MMRMTDYDGDVLDYDSLTPDAQDRARDSVLDFNRKIFRQRRDAFFLLPLNLRVNSGGFRNIVRDANSLVTDSNDPDFHASVIRANLLEFTPAGDYLYYTALN